MNSEITPKQQASELFKQAESVLIVTGRQPSLDQVMGVFALQTALIAAGKKAHAVITDELPSSSRVVDTGKISKTLDGVRDFIISLDLTGVEVEKLKYDIADNSLNVTITPHAGNFKPEDARFSYGAFQFDLVVVVGVAGIAKIDALLEQNPTLFDGIHLINYDYHRANEQYGSVNYIDQNATSVCEMLIGTIDSLGAGLMNADIATALLAGIMSTTNRFTTASTTAKSLTMAAQLMSNGARQQEIVKVLYSNSTAAKPVIQNPSKTLAEALPDETLQQLQAAAEQLKQSENLPQVSQVQPVGPIAEQV